MKKEIDRPVMVEFSYYDDDNPMADNIDLTFHTETDLEFKRFCEMCKAFAAAIGFSPQTIDTVFKD